MAGDHSWSSPATCWTSLVAGDPGGLASRHSRAIQQDTPEAILANYEQLSLSRRQRHAVVIDAACSDEGKPLGAARFLILPPKCRTATSHSARRCHPETELYALLRLRPVPVIGQLKEVLIVSLHPVPPESAASWVIDAAQA